MEFYVRLDEESKSTQQVTQREETYEAAKALRKLGYDVSVREHFTGKEIQCDAASIVIKLRS